jgi:hypothetical protein
MKSPYNFGEAFKVMRYEGAGGRREWVWNSRDGITPFSYDRQDEIRLVKRSDRDSFTPRHRGC